MAQRHQLKELYLQQPDFDVYYAIFFWAKVWEDFPLTSVSKTGLSGIELDAKIVDSSPSGKTPQAFGLPLICQEGNDWE